MKDLCSVCGCEIVEQSSYKPKLYCSDNCRNYMKYKNALEKVIMNLNPCNEARKIIRGDMFRLCNTLGNGTNTLKELNND